MNMNLLIAAILACTAATAGANTYMVKSDNDNANDMLKLAVSHAGKGACLYADKKVGLGDTLVVDGTDTVLVCAKAQRGPVFLPLSADAAKRVYATMPTQPSQARVSATASGANSEHAYKISTPPAPAFTPVMAWDDGTFTFIALSKPFHGELPVVFALAEDGSRSLVNFQWDEENARFVVHRVLDRAILVLGEQSVIVTRTASLKGIVKSGCESDCALGSSTSAL